MLPFTFMLLFSLSLLFYMCFYKILMWFFAWVASLNMDTDHVTEVKKAICVIVTLCTFCNLKSFLSLYFLPILVILLHWVKVTWVTVTSTFDLD